MVAFVDSSRDSSPKFDYCYVPVNDLRVVTVEDQKTGKQVVDHLLVHDEPIKDSKRFWTSLFARYGFNSAFFKYFDHAEVFQRISDVESNDRMRICIERHVDEAGSPTSRLMAVSNPTKPIVVYDELVELVDQYGGRSINYNDGVVESTHTPRIGSTSFEILGDMFDNRFLMQTPIDGYGMPSLYLSLLRQICSNGLVGYSKVFRNQLALGKNSDDVTPTLIRALEGFNNDEGYVALRQRIETAGRSWMSVYESQQLYNLLTRLHSKVSLDLNADIVDDSVDIIRHLGDEGETFSPILKSFNLMTGDPSELYGLANLDSLSAKRQRTLPVKCTVYDAINFATEAATHYADPAGSRQLQAWVGGCICEEYDMENTIDRFQNFEDFLIDSKLKVGLTGSN